MKSQRGVLGRMFGGWEVSGLYTFESGVPLNITNGLDADGLDGVNDRPLWNPAGRAGVRAIPGTVAGTFVNPDAAGRPLISPAEAQYIALPANTGATVAPTGNLGRNTFRSRPTNNLDLNFFKSINVSERKRFEFRVETYNALNHVQRGLGSVSPFSPGNSNPNLNVNAAPAGQFLNFDILDGGSRVIRYNLKFIF
jgi:hypothetical protein